ncbi:LysR substrate-binding domain-containing protein [Myxosarcina sp. GI1]|uniref:LysR family transcriptional regulator n=1 Tax=Myxosarcina sp. GI1 TaxID=1541065 RepID=UPI00055F7EFC|nr:LysR substrate-binding domain-containing protein [Myxosarcina sp. GI1]
MEIYQLKVFLEVARCLSFTEAAEVLNLTQPAVSAKIKSLEAELKTPLFDRQGRQIQLTEIGNYLVNEGRKLVELEAEIGKKLENFKQLKSSCLTIGSSHSLASCWLPQLIYQYRQKYPQIKIHLKLFGDSKLLDRAVNRGIIDLSFSETKFIDCPEILQQEIASIQYSLLVASSHSLAEKNWLSLPQIKHKPLVLLSDRFASHQVFESRLAELGLKLADFTNLEIVDTIGLMRTYLTQGNYLGFASDLEFQGELDSQTLTAITLQEFALAANIYASVSQQSNSYRDNPASKFLTLLSTQTTPKSNCEPALSVPKMKTPVYAQRTQSQETIAIDLGIQNITVPTVTAGLIVQRLGLLEHFLPRTGRYARVKYELNWHNFSLGTPIVKGLHSKKLDFGILGDYPLLESATQGNNEQFEPTLLVSFVSISPNGEGSAVIVPQTSKLETIEDLQGQTVALPFGSSAHGMLLRTLYHLNLLSEVQLFPLKNSQIEAPLESEIAAGYAYFSPFHQLASVRGNFKYLYNENTSGLPGFYGVVVRQSFAEAYPEIVVGYLKALMAAQYWLANTPSAFSLISQWTKIKPQILGSILSSTQAEASSLFVTDWQIRQDWLESHIAQLKSIPTVKHLGKINLNRWVEPEFLQTARQN